MERVDHALFESPGWKAQAASPLKEMARQQLGTVGCGNHYVDLFENGAISNEGFRSWLEAGRVSEGLAAKIEAERLRRTKEEREKEEKELAMQRTSDDALRAVGGIFGLLMVVLISIGALWLAVTLVRYFWTHPLF